MKASPGSELPAFQREAANLIVERLQSTKGPRRFLLADEVGLGKTHVAAEVIRQLRGGGALAVLYVCSNAEIARQNLRKLGRDAQDLPVERLGLLAASSRTIARGRGKRALQIFPVTPGTSFELGRGFGLARERRLILYLLHRLYGYAPSRFREALRGQAGDPKHPRTDWWRKRAALGELRKDFGHTISAALLRSLRKQWKSCKVPDATKPGPGPAWKSCKVSDAAKLGRGPALTALVGAMRVGLARAALESIQPELVILDEFQKYRSQIDESEDAKDKPITRWLFKDRRLPILLLSATPYRLYTTRADDKEQRSHWEELFDVLRFLRRDTDAAWTTRLADQFERFQDLLRQVAVGTSDDDKARIQLLALKGQLEAALGSVMSRTERNWYVDSLGEALGAPVYNDTVPSSDELRDYLQVRRALDSDGWISQVTDFWKSSPAFVSFLSRHYALRDFLRKRKKEQPLLLRAREATSAYQRNMKMRRLHEELFGPGDEKTVPLWVPPTYPAFLSKIQRGTGSGTEKQLVFSHWRFVPGMIAGLTSLAVERKLKIRGSLTAAVGPQFSLPLRLDHDGPFTSFDVCFPEPRLAALTDPFELAAKLQMAPCQVSRRILENLAFRRVKNEIPRALLGQGLTRPWEVHATFLAGEASGRLVDGLRKASKGLDAPLKDYARRYDRWCRRVEHGEARKASAAAVRQLALIGLFSPANALYRCIRRNFGDDITRAVYPELIRVGFSGLRAYWNRETTQAIVRRWGRRRTYSSSVVDYCAVHQFEAMLDEYVFLLASQLGHAKEDRTSSKDNAEIKKVALQVLETLERVFGLSAGAPIVRVRDGKPRQLRSHFAVAFIEEDESTAGRQRSQRRAAVREAFNSPFWPFVLATTSIGQEGLDFHLYCRNVVHWNLPTNPVDLEQREGRINRRNSLAIRRSMRHDVDPSELKRTDAPLMKQAMDTILQRGTRHAHEKHGLYPHWIHENAKGCPESFRRHLPIYGSSADVDRYARLLRRLSLYRLAFGQANQDALLDELDQSDKKDLATQLAPYMLNLAPFRGTFAWQSARQEAAHRLRDPRGADPWLAALRSDCEYKLKEVGDGLGAPAIKACQRLIAFTDQESSRRAPTRQVNAVAALVYFRNPYDDRFDIHRVVGLQDDATRLIQAARGIQ